MLFHTHQKKRNHEPFELASVGRHSSGTGIRVARLSPAAVLRPAETLLLLLELSQSG